MGVSRIENTDAQWNAGQRENVVASSNVLTVAQEVAPVTVERTENTGAVWGTGTRSNVVASGNDLILTQSINYSKSSNYYDNGTERHSFVAGYSTGNGSLSKQTDHLYLTATGTATNSERTYVINTAVSMTGLKYIRVQWAQSGSGPTSNFMSTLVVSTSKTGTKETYSLRSHHGGTFAKRVDQIDVGGLTGNHYVRVHASIAWNDAQSVLRVYAIWGVDANGNIVYVYEYNTQGYRISPYLSIGGIVKAAGSLIQFSTSLPTGTSVSIYAMVSSSTSPPSAGDAGWNLQTHNSALTVISVGGDYTGKYLWIKAVLSTTNLSYTPKLSSLYVKVTQNQTFYSSAYRISPALDAGSISKVNASIANFSRSAPAGTTAKIYALVNSYGGAYPGRSDAGWQELTSGAAIAGIAQGQNLEGKFLWLKQEFAATDTSVRAQISSLTVVVGQDSARESSSHLKVIVSAALRYFERWREAGGFLQKITSSSVRVSIELHRESKTYVAPICGVTSSTLHKWERVWVPLGVFWSGDWHAPEDAVYARTAGRDRLELLRMTDYSAGQVTKDLTLYNFAQDVLQDAGLAPGEGYWIDDELKDFVIPYAWAEPQSHREILRKIAEACLGQVYCDRSGVLRIEGPSFLAAKDKSELEISMDDYFKKDNPVKWSEIANWIEVETQPLLPEEMQEIYRDNEPVSIAAGQPVSMTIMYNHSPCINPAARLEGADEQSTPPAGCVIEKITYYAWGADVKVTSPASGTFILVIEGQPLKVMNQQKIIARDEDSIKEHGVVQHAFPANPYVQTVATARLIADRLLASFKDPRRDLDLTWRGNLALELADRITVPDFKGTGLADFHVTQQTLDYAGGLRCTLKGRRAVDEEEK